MNTVIVIKPLLLPRSYLAGSGYFTVPAGTVLPVLDELEDRVICYFAAEDRRVAVMDGEYCDNSIDG